MKKILTVGGKDYLIKCSPLDFCGAYYYTIYIIIPQNRFFKKKFFCSGDTSGWDDDINIEQAFKEIIESTTALILAETNQINKIEKFFENS